MYRSLLPLALLSFTAQAQPTLQLAGLDLVGNTYDVHVLADLDAAALDPDGAAAQWDIATASFETLYAAVTFGAPAGTPYAAAYPTSNLAQTSILPGGTEYNYLVADAAGLHLLADGVDAGGGTVYTEAKTVLQFPLAYQDQFTDTYVVDGTTYTHTRQYSGHGTLTTPIGTFTGVVKVASASGTVDFYRTAPIEPLLHYEPSGTVVLFTRTLAGVAEHGAQPALYAYPNPATEQVTIGGLTAGGTWQLVDLQGRVLLSGVTAPLMQVPLAGLAAGTYVMQATHHGTVRRATVLKN